MIDNQIAIRGDGNTWLYPDAVDAEYTARRFNDMWGILWSERRLLLFTLMIHGY